MGHDASNARLLDFVLSIPDAFSVAHHAQPAHAQALRLLSNGAAAGAEAITAVMAVRRMASTDFRNERLRKFVPYNSILSELMRRMEPDASSRFASLFDANYRRAYPQLASAFPDAAVRAA
mmetsp:Transcript_22556/g.48721  ORF Transcript_22556/g.48721 Transcript_22556/m.48721 type:complete len:121 (-) Transcript_22556:196-558(-)